MNYLIKFVLSFGFLLTLGSCDKNYEPGSPEHIQSVTLGVDNEQLQNADENPGDWLTYGRNYSEDRYSTLNQVTKANIKDLGLAWSLDI